MADGGRRTCSSFDMFGGEEVSGVGRRAAVRVGIRCDGGFRSRLLARPRPVLADASARAGVWCGQDHAAPGGQGRGAAGRLRDHRHRLQRTDDRAGERAIAPAGPARLGSDDLIVLGFNTRSMTSSPACPPGGATSPPAVTSPWICSCRSSPFWRRHRFHRP